MNIKKIEKQLKKINQLFETIKDDGTVSSIEKDLMLSYVRGLYEKLLEPQNESQKNDSPKKRSSISDSKPIEIIKEKKVEVPVQQPNPVASAVLQEVEEADQFNSYTEPVSHQATEPKVEYTSAIQQETMVQEVIETAKPQIPAELASLFQQESNNELSDKLSRSPIADLTKSMGINEKIFTVQELFGGDSALFAKSMESMDKLSSLEQARDYLVEHVALDQNWMAEDKIKKAANFIKLISRRY